MALPPIDIGTAAAIVELSGVARRLLTKLRDRLRLLPEERSLVEAIDAALAAAMQKAGPPGERTSAVRAALRDLIMSPESDVLAAALNPTERSTRISDLSSVGPDSARLIQTFAQELRAEIFTRAQRPDSPIFNLVAVGLLEAMARQSSEMRETLRSEGLLASLPATTAAHLERLETTNAELAKALARWVADPAPRVHNIRRLLVDTPSWLASASDPAAWRILAELADAHSARPAALVAYERAAALDPDPDAALLWRLRSIQSREADRASALEGELRDATTTTQRAFIRLLIAADDTADAETILRVAPDALGLHPEADLIAEQYRAQAAAISGDLDTAIDVLTQVAGPDRTGARLLLADYLLRRSVKDVSPNRSIDAVRAFDLALEVRDARRAWGGDSGPAALIAAQSAAASNDWARVIELGALEGGATHEEAQVPGLAELVAAARIFTAQDSQRDADQAASTMSPSGSAWIRGLAIGPASPERRTEALQLMTEAADAAADLTELERALRGLAALGAEQLPRIEELAAGEPDHAAAIQALASYRSSASIDALAQMRVLAMRTRIAVAFVASIEAERANHAASAAAWLDGARRFGDPAMYVFAAHALIEMTDPQAEAVAREGLSRLPTNSPARAELLNGLVTIAVKNNDPGEIVQACRAAISDGSTDRRLPWLAAEALRATGRLDDAWQMLAEEAAPPESATEAKFYLALRSEADADLDLSLAVMDRFEDAHDVIATGLLRWLIDEPTDPPSEEQAARFGAHLQRFTERFPDSPVLRSFSIDSEDPDRAADQVAALLPDFDAEIEDGLTRLSGLLARGELPAGLVALALRRNTIEILNSGSLPPLPLVASPADELEREIRAARDALDGQVVLDLAALYALSLTPDRWHEIIGSFAQVSCTVSQIAEVREFARVKRSAGSFRQAKSGFVVSDYSEEVVQDIAQRAQWMLEHGSTLDAVPVKVREPLTEAGDHEFAGTWADALHLAAATGRPLLTDDVALARLARAAGIPAFGTFAAIRADRGRRQQSIDDDLDELFAAGVYPLPVPPMSLAALAERAQWPLLPILCTFARPSWWPQTRAAEATKKLALALTRADRSRLPDVCVAVTRGAFDAVVESARPGFVGSVLAGLLATLGVSAGELPAVLAAIRFVCGDEFDPLRQIAKTWSDDLIELVPAEVRRSYLVGLFSMLDDADRRIVAEVLLTTSPDASA